MDNKDDMTNEHPEVRASRLRVYDRLAEAGYLPPRDGKEVSPEVSPTDEVTQWSQAAADRMLVRAVLATHDVDANRLLVGVIGSARTRAALEIVRAQTDMGVWSSVIDRLIAELDQRRAEARELAAKRRQELPRVEPDEQAEQLLDQLLTRGKGGAR